MVINKRYLIEIKDILSIRLTCSKCDVSVNIPISDKGKVPVTCPSCKQDLFQNKGVQPSISALIEDLLKLKEMSDLRLQIEIEQPESK